MDAINSLDREKMHNKVKKDEYRREMDYYNSLKKERLKNEEEADRMQKEIDLRNIASYVNREKQNREEYMRRF